MHLFVGQGRGSLWLFWKQCFCPWLPCSVEKWQRPIVSLVVNSAAAGHLTLGPLISRSRWWWMVVCGGWEWQCGLVSSSSQVFVVCMQGYRHRNYCGHLKFLWCGILEKVQYFHSLGIRISFFFSYSVTLSKLNISFHYYKCFQTWCFAVLLSAGTNCLEI